MHFQPVSSNHCFCYFPEVTLSGCSFIPIDMETKNTVDYLGRYIATQWLWAMMTLKPWLHAPLLIVEAFGSGRRRCS